MDDVAKTCTKCRTPKPLTEFGVQARGKYGRRAQCKSCRAGADRARYEDNRDTEVARSRIYRESHQDQLNAAARDRYASLDASERQARGRAHRARNADTIREANRRYRQTNIDAVRSWKRWSQAKRKAAKLGVAFGRVDLITVASWTDCYLCGQVLADDVHVDHLVPLARGGSHSTENLRPVHAGCNLRKHDTYLTDLDWYPGSALLGAWTVQPVTCSRGR